MNPARLILGCGVVFALSAMAATAQEPANQPPVIRHQPVTVAVRGQPVTVLAHVTDDSGLVKSVTLFYSLSKDAAPFRVPMKSSGTSLYLGTIPAAVVSGADRMSYYIEAMDQVEAAQETPWQSVAIKDASAREKTAEPKQAVAPVSPPAQEKEGANLLGMGIIAGGAAAVLGGAVLMANSGDGDSDGGDGDGVQAGTYSGTVTECETISGGSPHCTSHAMSIVIDDQGAVASSSLRTGDTLQGTLRGNDFTLIAELDGSGTNGTGEVVYSGTVVDQRILGSITGSRQTVSETASYSGTFSATLN